jgi:hypothetical protein
MFTFEFSDADLLVVSSGMLFPSVELLELRLLQQELLRLLLLGKGKHETGAITSSNASQLEVVPFEGAEGGHEDDGAGVGVRIISSVIRVRVRQLPMLMPALVPWSASVVSCLFRVDTDEASNKEEEVLLGKGFSGSISISGCKSIEGGSEAR